MKPYQYAVLAVGSYLLFTLASTPAASVISLARSQFNLPAQFYGVQGSIWRGQADTLIVQNHTIEQLQWSLNPAALLIASLSADIQASIRQQNIIGHVSMGLNGKLQAQDLRARLDAADIQQLINMPFGELDGTFNLNIDSLTWHGTGLPETSGSVIWRNAKLTLVDSVDLGQMQLKIQPDDKEGLLIEINNKGGMLSVDGQIEVDKNKQYRLSMDFKPENNAHASLGQSLAMFARRQSNGSYRLVRNGNLNQLGL